MYQIVHQCPEFVLIDKAACVHFHSQDGSAGVIAQLEADLGCKLYPVHRLDTPTSGLLLVAKRSDVAAELSQQFADHRIEKRYLALSDKKPSKKQGTIEGGMAKARRSQWKLTRDRDNYAITQFVTESLGDGLRAYLLRPLSGRTHQIRVAMKSLGAPIIGDALYGGSDGERTYLHAFHLAFQLGNHHHQYFCPPQQGELYQLPQLQQALSRWQQTDANWPKRK